MKRTVPTPKALDACMIHEGEATYCIDPLEEPLRLLSKRWALLTIGVLGNRPGLRFSEAQRALTGITARALSDVLTSLQAAGLARRVVDAAATPPAVRYELLARGAELRKALLPLLRWAAQEAPGPIAGPPGAPPGAPRAAPK